MHPTLFITIPDIEAVESLRVPVPFLSRDDSLSLTTDHATMFDLFDSQATKLPVSESGLDLTDPYQSKNIQALGWSIVSALLFSLVCLTFLRFVRHVLSRLPWN